MNQQRSNHTTRNHCEQSAAPTVSVIGSHHQGNSLEEIQDDTPGIEYRSSTTTFQADDSYANVVG